MKYKNISKELLEQVKPSDIIEYLTFSLWNENPSPFNDVRVYRKEKNEETYEILLPTKTSFVDYPARIWDAIEIIGEVEDQDTSYLLNELILPLSDIIKFKLEGEQTKNGTICLDIGIQLLEGAKKAMTVSAFSALEPKKYYSRLQNKDVETLLKSCKLGQTERGSFVATLVCPIQGQQRIDPDTSQIENFGRKVTKNMMISISKIVNSITNNTIENLINPHKDEVIISSNLCESIVNMLPEEGEGDFNLDITTLWSKKFVLETNIPSQVRIKNTYSKTISEIASKLYPSREPSNKYFRGQVDTLSGEADKETKNMYGEVILSLMVDNNIVKAKVILSHDDYMSACDAHKNNMYISINGTLNYKPRISKIDNYQNFNIS